MSKNKNQHFVPQFYLKNFSDDRKHIAVLHLPSDTYRAANLIKNEASEAHFYGKDNPIETVLQSIEAKGSQLVRAAIVESELPEPGSQEYFDLLQLLVVLRFRTTVAGEHHNERFGDSIRTDMIRRLTLDVSVFEDIRIVDRNASAVGVQNAILSTPVVFDLKLKLLVNRSGNPFFTSDHPCILYNQMFEKKRPEVNNTGLAAKGLQIICPISPEQCILFYDRSTYLIGKTSEPIVYVDNPRDVERLNLLQLASADAKLFAPTSWPESDLQNFVVEHAAIRQAGWIAFRTETVSKSESEVRILKVMPELRTKLQLSFVGLNLQTLRDKASAVGLIPRSRHALEMHAFAAAEMRRLVASVDNKDPATH